jgi:hypothetical protein
METFRQKIAAIHRAEMLDPDRTDMVIEAVLEMIGETQPQKAMDVRETVDDTDKFYKMGWNTAINKYRDNLIAKVKGDSK